jgi:D-arabinose 5-phosphate isomerase GutQ
LGRSRLIGVAIALSMALLGVVYPVLTATTVVETVTETVVQPGRTITTVTVLEGGDVVIRIESPGIRIIVYYERQQQVCVVRFTAMPLPGQPGVIAFPGTTVTVPGATATLVLNAPT